MASFESDPELMAYDAELMESAPQSLDGVLRAMAGMDVGGTPVVHEGQRNTRELIENSHGIRLSSFAFGADLVLTTMHTVKGEDGHLRMTLVPWPGQELIEDGTPVRAFVTESNIFGVEPESEIHILGASSGHISLDSSHYGEVRARCNLMVTPIKFEEACQTGLAPEKLKEMEKEGFIERAERGPLKGRYVIPDINGPSVVLPEVIKLDRVNPVTETPERQHWMRLPTLES